MLNKFHQLRSKYKGEFLFVLSNYSTPLVGLVASIVAAAYIDPEDFGAIQAVLLVVPYVSLLQMGTFNGLNRNLSFYKARGEFDKVQKMVNASKTVANLVSGVGGAIAIALFFYYFSFQEARSLVCLTTLSLFLILFFTPHVTHLETTFRSGQEFATLGRIKFFENTVNILVGLLPMLIGYIGRIIYDGFKPFLESLLRYKYRPYKAVEIGELSEIKDLVATGFPLIVGGYILQLFLVADQSVIAIFLGEEQLGFYTLSKLILLAVPIIPTSLGMVLYPKASADYGKYQSNKSLRPFFMQSLLLNVIVLLPICLVIYLLLEPVTLWVMPKYEPGIQAAKINVLTCFTFVSNGPSIIVGVVRKNTPIIIANFVALAVIWLSTWIIMQYSILDIEAIAWVRFCVALLLSLVTIGYSYYLTTIDEFNK